VHLVLIPPPRVLLAVLALVPATAWAAVRPCDDPPGTNPQDAVEAPADDTRRDFADMSLEELMNLEVTVASRVTEGFMGAPAAVYVLTGDEIRRSGFTSIQEAMRMVPGFQVAQWHGSAWDLTARGFSSNFSNQLLVMIDGVSVYTPLYAGVFWELQAIPMSEIERIEVIRGPGATLWGANAVNGIINVVTKHSADSQGALLSGTAGKTERNVTARYGAPLSDNGTWSFWINGQDHDGLVDSLGADDPTQDWGILKGGFRADWNLGEGERLRVQANGYAAEIGESYGVSDPNDPNNFQFVVDDTPKTGFSVVGAWEIDDSDSSTTRLQAWYARDNQKQVDFESAVDQLDVEVQRTQQLSADNTLVWGLGDRLVHSEQPGDFTLTFDPESRTLNTPRLFAQDEWRLPSSDLKFVLGASVEHNDFTGVEFQPSARVAWQPSAHQTFWAAASRAVRTPSIAENDRRLNIQLDNAGNYLALLGSKDVVSEELIAYELGWRWQPTQRVSLDLASFVNQYDDLVTMEDGAPFTQGGNSFTTLVNDNKGSAVAWGFEAAVDVAVTSAWKIRSAYTLFHIVAEADADSTDVNFTDIEDSSPKNQANLRSYLDLGDNWELDLGLYYMDHVAVFDTPSFLRADLRLGWNPNPDIEFSVGAQNVFDDHHPEDNPTDSVGFGTEVERNVYVRLTLRR
jgi:iron complex outermembrane recepter protein